jgi:hypothetical protein
VAASGGRVEQSTRAELSAEDERLVLGENLLRLISNKRERHLQLLARRDQHSCAANRT